MKNKWGNYAINSGKVQSCYQREYINRKKCRQAAETSGGNSLECCGQVQKKEVDVEEIQGSDCRRSDSVADVQSIISQGIIEPVQDVTRCKPERRRQKSSADTTSNRPKNKPSNQKRVKEPSSGCNTGMANFSQGST